MVCFMDILITIASAISSQRFPAQPSAAECWTAALPSAGAEMSAAVDAAAQWTPRTPLEAIASVSICDEEDEDGEEVCVRLLRVSYESEG